MIGTPCVDEWCNDCRYWVMKPHVCPHTPYTKLLAIVGEKDALLIKAGGDAGVEAAWRQLEDAYERGYSAGDPYD